MPTKKKRRKSGRTELCKVAYHGLLNTPQDKWIGTEGHNESWPSCSVLLQSFLTFGSNAR
jgi:hypothetical protein